MLTLRRSRFKRPFHGKKVSPKMTLQDLRLTGSEELAINLFLPLLPKLAIPFCFSVSKVISILLGLENYIYILIGFNKKISTAC